MMGLWGVMFLNPSGAWVEYRILGRIEVLQDGSPLPILAPRHRKLLATLLVHADHVVPSDKLIEDLWGHEPPSSAPAILHVRISELRNQLRGGRAEDTVGILTRGSGYQLVLGPDDLDARSFERLSAAGHSALRRGDNVGASTRLAEALAIWRGPALADVADEQFAQAEIARLDTLHVQTLEDDLDVELALGRHEEVVARLGALVAEHPLHERFWCQLMMAQYRAGRQADALQSFSHARELLVEELGVDPGPELQRMHAAVLSQDLYLSPPAPFTPAHEPPNNLPWRLTSFVGREAERSRVQQLLRRKRLVTVVGTGGVGKSRLALEVAREALHHYGGGVWLVELAAVTAPDRVVAAVAAAAGVREHPEHTLTELLVDRFSSRPTILVLDNCEHLLDAAAAMGQELLESCPQLTILATSRERLGITGEALEPLTGLGVPGLGTGESSGSPAGEAERLFADRAQTTEPDLDLSGGNGVAVAQICRRLDGLPLAIELAAARVNALSVQEIAARLDDRFRLLDSGQRTAVTRHQTLRAVVAWSYSLLTAAEARFFDAASAFVGGFTLDAAEFVCADLGGDSHDAAGLLWRLVDKSLVSSENALGSRRYRMLETLRAYGQERLAARDELERVKERHSVFYLTFAEPAAAGLRGSEQQTWLDRLELEHGNIRAALSWSVDHGRAETALRLAGAVYSLWDLHGHYSEGCAWLTQVLAMEGDVAPAVRARALMGLATLATIQGDFELGASACQEAAELCAGAEDLAGLAHAQQYLGLGCIFAEDLDTADALLQESLTNARLAEDAWLEAWVFVFLGALALAREDHAGAVSTAGICELVARRAGDPECVAWAQLIGATGQQLDNPDVSVAELREAIVAFQRLGAIWGLSLAVFMAALRASAHDQSRRALRLFSASERMRASIGATLMNFMATRLASAIAAARAELSKEMVDEAWHEGAGLSLGATAAEALAELDAHR
jgi:predicted ATPase/DNA-binding SARP family transcriptional activator